MKENSPLSKVSAKFQTANDGCCNVAVAKWSRKPTAWSRSIANCVPTSHWSMTSMAQALTHPISQHFD